MKPAQETASNLGIAKLLGTSCMQHVCSVGNFRMPPVGQGKRNMEHRIEKAMRDLAALWQAGVHARIPPSRLESVARALEYAAASLQETSPAATPPAACPDAAFANTDAAEGPHAPLRRSLRTPQSTPQQLASAEAARKTPSGRSRRSKFGGAAEGRESGAQADKIGSSRSKAPLFNPPDSTDEEDDSPPPSTPSPTGHEDEDLQDDSYLAQTVGGSLRPKGRGKKGGKKGGVAYDARRGGKCPTLGQVSARKKGPDEHLVSVSYGLAQPHHQRQLGELHRTLSNQQAPSIQPPSISSTSLDFIGAAISDISASEGAANLACFHKWIGLINLTHAVHLRQREILDSEQRASSSLRRVYSELKPEPSVSAHKFRDWYREGLSLLALIRSGSVYLLMALAVVHQEIGAKFFQRRQSVHDFLRGLEDPLKSGYLFHSVAILSYLKPCITLLRRAGPIPISLCGRQVELGRDPVEDAAYYTLQVHSHQEDASFSFSNHASILHSLGLDFPVDSSSTTTANKRLAMLSAASTKSSWPTSVLSNTLQLDPLPGWEGTEEHDEAREVEEEVASVDPTVVQDILRSIRESRKISMEIASNISLGPAADLPTSFTLGDHFSKQQLLEHLERKKENETTAEASERLYHQMLKELEGAREIRTESDFGENFKLGTEWVHLKAELFDEAHFVVSSPDEPDQRDGRPREPLIHILPNGTLPSKLVEQMETALEHLLPTALVDKMATDKKHFEATTLHLCLWNRFGSLSKVDGMAVGKGNGGGLPYKSDDMKMMDFVGAAYMSKMEGFFELNRAILQEYQPSAYKDLQSVIQSLDGIATPLTDPYTSVVPNVNICTRCHVDPDLKFAPSLLAALGRFTGGAIFFPELKLIIDRPRGSVAYFLSGHLIHGNLPVTSGQRNSLVMSTDWQMARWRDSLNGLRAG